MKSTIIAGIIGTTAAIDAQAACQSACGLVASMDQCKIVKAEGGVCKMLLTNEETLKYGAKIHDEFRPLRIAEAIDRVRAPTDNCFAMCYENEDCKPMGSYCTRGGVCPNLYWDQSATGSFEYSFYTEDATNQVNVASAVLCDFQGSEQPVETEDLPGYVDPCPAICSLSHSASECALVQRSKDVCHRLFWSDASATATKFVVATPTNEDITVTVESAFELLKQDCVAVCDANKDCVLGSSTCSEDNRTCKDLFYNPSSPQKDSLSICYGEKCKITSIPVMCELSGDKKGAIANKTVSTGAFAEAASTTPKQSSILNAIVAIGMVALISLV